MAYFEVKVFNQTAKVYLNWSLTASYKTNKLTKRRKNLVDQGSSTSSIFSCFRGISCECSTFYSRLSSLIAEKRREPKDVTKNWSRTRFRFNLLRPQLLYLRK